MLAMWDVTRTVVEAYLWSLLLFATIFVLLCIRLSQWYKNRTFFCLTYDQLFGISRLKESECPTATWVNVCEKANLVFGSQSKNKRPVLAVKKDGRIRVVARQQYAHMIYVPNKYSEQFSAFLSSLK